MEAMSTSAQTLMEALNIPINQDMYDLGSDGLACIAQQCQLRLLAPQNGNISCDGDQVTMTTCNFSCDPGYSLIGSMERRCQPNNSWSGSNTSCDIMLCEVLQSPSNGFVVLPCNREFQSVCTVTCGDGYYTEGPYTRSCEVSKSGMVEWSIAPICGDFDETTKFNSVKFMHKERAHTLGRGGSREVFGVSRPPPEINCTEEINDVNTTTITTTVMPTNNNNNNTIENIIPIVVGVSVAVVIVNVVVIVVIIIAIIWYCKCSQKYHISNDTQSDVPKITNVSAKAVELETNPSYGTIRKEAQQITVNYPPVDERVDITANPSYTPFLKSEDEVNPLYSSARDVQDSAYDYI